MGALPSFRTCFGTAVQVRAVAVKVLKARRRQRRSRRRLRYLFRWQRPETGTMAVCSGGHA
jgi:hypothetical protein